VSQERSSNLPPLDLLPPREPYGVRLDYPARLNLADELVTRSMDSGAADAPAIFYGDRTLSYRELDGRASRCAGGLRQLGIQPGDRVMLRFFNRPDAVVAWLAVQKLGAVAVFTMPLLRARELEYIANDSESRCLLVSSDLLEEVAKARERFRTIDTLVVAGEPVSGTVAFEELAAGEAVASREVGRDEPALIAYTSGSTGVPKGCVHFPSDVLASADTYGKEILSPRPVPPPASSSASRRRRCWRPSAVIERPVHFVLRPLTRRCSRSRAPKSVTSSAACGCR
jgi:2-aminobenzoate-CoA ligase